MAHAKEMGTAVAIWDTRVKRVTLVPRSTSRPSRMKESSFAHHVTRRASTSVRALELSVRIRNNKDFTLKLKLRGYQINFIELYRLPGL